jgi:DNA-binding transcriptional LysR family regulator
MKMKSANLSGLKYMEAVIAERSIRKAAERLDMPASALCRHIKLLESEVDAILFDRCASGVRPTAAAELLVDHFRISEAHRDSLDMRLAELKDLRRGSICVAASEGLIASLTDDVLWPFNREHPEVRISLQMKATGDIVTDVMTGAVDIGLAYGPPHTEGLRFHANARHAVVAAVSPMHPLAQHEGSVTFGRAISYPFATMPAVYGLGRLVEAVASAEPLRFAPALRANTLEILKRYAIAGLGVALVTDFSVASEVAAGTLIARPINHPMLEKPYVRVFVHADRTLSHAAAELLRWIETRMTVFSAGS